MPKISKTEKAITFILAFREIHKREPTRKEIEEEIGKTGNAIYNMAYHQSKNTQLKITKAQQRHIDAIIKVSQKEIDSLVELKLQPRIREYMDKYMPDLKARREELIDKIDNYNKITNKFKPVFNSDEFKSILMCLHPDGERSKEKLEEVFILVKSKEKPLTGKK